MGAGAGIAVGIVNVVRSGGSVAVEAICNTVTDRPTVVGLGGHKKSRTAVAKDLTTNATMVTTTKYCKGSIACIAMLA